MAISILTNVPSLDAQRNLNNTQVSLNKNISHLSSGMRITSAADDAAGQQSAEAIAGGERHLVQHGPDADPVGDVAGQSQRGTTIRNPAARDADACLGTIYQAIERAGILNDTLVIVSADHGGHNHNHSGALLSDRNIPWIAMGPGVRRGYSIQGPISTMDTAATALAALERRLDESTVAAVRRGLADPDALRRKIFGLNAAARVLARDLAPRRIRVLAVCPGWVRTGMGGPGAPRSVEEGARGVVWAVTAPDAPREGFFRDGAPIPW